MDPKQLPENTVIMEDAPSKADLVSLNHNFTTLTNNVSDLATTVKDLTTELRKEFVRKEVYVEAKETQDNRIKDLENTISRAGWIIITAVIIALLSTVLVTSGTV